MIVDYGKTLKLLKDLTRQDILSCRICKVIDIDSTAFTCTVSPIDSPDISVSDIKLSPNKLGQFVAFPKVDSLVIVSFFDKASGYISMFSEVEKYYQATQTESILDIMNDFITAIKNIQLLHPQGATSPNGVINIADFIDIENRLKNFYLK